MPEKGFDIESILHFKPPKYFCEKCYALLTGYDEIRDENKKKFICPVCEVEYIPTGDYTPWEILMYFKDNGFEIEFDNLIAHCQKLARISNRARRFLKTKKKSDSDLRFSPLRALFLSLQSAQKFIHFSSYGISHMILGAIKMAAQRVDVRGIVSNVDKKMIIELTEFKHEAPKLETKIFERENKPQKRFSSPHQKIIIIDGLMAFKGSANLTISGWRKAAEGREMIELVTDVKEVIELNNSYFSPVWAETSDIEEIRMEKVVPF